MPLPGRLFENDEERGKKDDDHRPNGRSGVAAIRAWRSPRRRRLLLVVLGVVVLYLFFKNMPTNVPPVSQRYDLRFAPNLAPNQAQQPPPSPPSGAPPRTPRVKNNDMHYFEGPIKFYNLAVSLHLVYAMMGHRFENRNVLFAASNLKSVSNMLPLACEMSRRSTNIVHFAIMGRDDISIDHLKAVNGLSNEECGDLRWHDGRPDYSAYSTDYRMSISVRAGLANINTFMHPQVVIIDGSGQEDEFFPKSIKAKAADIRLSVLELPSGAGEKMMWISTLDSSSMKNWNKVEVEILIHAPPASSGSLIRLLKSIEKADYFGSELPSLTVELPADIDGPTTRFLEDMKWPPHADNESPNSKITLRHRIPSSRMGPVEASIRTVESFYPKISSFNHVLILSPQAELSPLYYHYLKYLLLKYRYSASAGLDFSHVAGISLDLPFTQLNGSAPFKPPSSSQPSEVEGTGKNDQSNPSLFLWQAPNSNAAIYFGDKWVEFHHFLSDHFTVLGKDPTEPPAPKLVSQAFPAWMEYLLELMRSKGYFLLYPALTNGVSIVTIHNELYQAPEEFSGKSFDDGLEHTSESSASDEKPKPATDAVDETVLSRHPSILQLLSFTPGLDLPTLSYAGEPVAGDAVAVQ